MQTVLDVLSTSQDQAMLGQLIDDLQTTFDNESAGSLPGAVAKVLAEYADVERLLEPGQRVGRREQYTRHLLYAHPAGQFSIVALVWQPGQFTPVHGHFTWCSYAVVHGDMVEDQFQWHADRQEASLIRTVDRGFGSCVASHAGMDTIHRLRNAGTDAAISIHVYGVEGSRISTHVNRIAPVVAGESAPVYLL